MTLSLRSLAGGGLLAAVAALTAGGSAQAATVAPAPVQAGAVSQQAGPASGTWRFGASLNDANDAARLSAMMGRPLTSGRVYFPGAPPTKWSDSSILLSVPSNGIVTVSFKAGDPAQVGAFLAGHPATQKCYASYYPEPEDNFPTAAGKAGYQAAWARYAPEIRKAGCVPTAVLMAWSLNPNSGRDWHDWYPKGNVDVLAWDMYNTQASKGLYAAPADMFKRVFEVRTETGLPVGVPEVGSTLAVGTTPAARAAWAHSFAVYARTNGVLFADWWDSAANKPAGGTKDYTMDTLIAQGWHR